MKLHAIASVLLGQILGCASPQLLLPNPGTVVLTKGDETIEITEGMELALKWSADGKADSTRVVVDGESRLVSGRIIEANEVYVRLKSANWNDRRDLPADYLESKDLQMSLHSGRYKKPLVGVPIGQIEEIILYSREAKSRQAPGFVKMGKWMAAGAAGGFMLVMSGEAERSFNPNIKGSEVLAGSVLGAAVGVVGYPIYKYLKSDYEKMPRVYPVGDREFQIEIRR